MKRTRVALYCYSDDNVHTNQQRIRLDTQFFCLMAFAHANSLEIVDYYEDIKDREDQASQSGWASMIFDCQNKYFDMVLVVNDKVLPDNIQMLPFDVLSIDTLTLKKQMI